MSWKDGAEDECYERYLKEQKSGASMSTNAIITNLKARLESDRTADFNKEFVPFQGRLGWFNYV